MNREAVTLQDSVKKWYSISLNSAELRELQVDMGRQRDRNRRNNESFTDFDWAHVVEQFLEKKGYEFTRMVSRKTSKEEGKMRERLTERSREAADILAEIESLEKKLVACDDSELAAKADEIAKEEKKVVSNPQGAELKDVGDQNAKANANWPLSEEERTKVALKLVKLANALLGK